MPGKVLVAPKAHIEHVVRDMDGGAFRPCHLLSPGSRQGNAHLHRHIAALPPGTPYPEQQLGALDATRGVLRPSGEVGARIRAAIPRAR